MNTVMNTGTRTSAVLLATAALVATGTGIAVADTPAPAAAAAQVATPPLGATKGFWVTNDSTHPLVVWQTSDDSVFDSRPANGTVIAPGQPVDFEMKWTAFQNNSAVVYFLEQQPDGSLAPAFQESMSFDMLGNYDATYTDDGAGLVGTVTGNEYLTVTDPAAR